MDAEGPTSEQLEIAQDVASRAAQMTNRLLERRNDLASGGLGVEPKLPGIVPQKA